MGHRVGQKIEVETWNGKIEVGHITCVSGSKNDGQVIEYETVDGEDLWCYSSQIV